VSDLESGFQASENDFTVMVVFCTKCGAQNEDFGQNCSQCGSALPKIGAHAPGYQAPPDYKPYEPTYQPIQPPAPMYQSGPTDWQRLGADKKIVAGILAIVIGGLGIHKFVLGYQKEGMVMLLVSVLSCFTLAGIMHVIAIVEGIMYLTKSDEDFVRTYIQGRKGWF
jgi:TM2 domain-containing membrane protein YozV